MAENDGTLRTHPDSSTTLSAERASVCLQASTDMAVMATVLGAAIAAAPDACTKEGVARCFAEFMLQRANLLLSGLSDELEPLHSLRQRCGTN